jgi:ubiquinol-cytochrome c reductase cytochrome c subunit
MKTLLVIIAMLAGTQGAAPGTPKGSAENGKALFMKFGCYECHGREGQGAVTGPRLNQNPITYARFTAYIRKPSGEMPPYTTKVVSEQQAADIYAFLQSLPKPPAVESVPLLR